MRLEHLTVVVFVGVAFAQQPTDSILSILLSEASSIYSSYSAARASEASISTTGSTTDTTDPSTVFGATTGDSQTDTLTRSTITSITISTATIPTTTGSTSISSPSPTASTGQTPIVVTVCPPTSSGANGRLNSGTRVNNHDKIAAIVLGSILGALILGLLILLAIILLRRREVSPDKKEAKHLLQPKGGDSANLVHPPRLSQGGRIDYTPQTAESPTIPQRSLARDNPARVTDGNIYSASTPYYQDEPLVKRPGSVQRARIQAEMQKYGAVTRTATRGQPIQSAMLRKPVDPQFHSAGGAYPRSVSRDLSNAPGIVDQHKRKGSVFPEDFHMPLVGPLSAHPTTAADIMAARTAMVTPRNLNPQHSVLDEGPGPALPGRSSLRDPRQSLGVPPDHHDRHSTAASSISRRAFAAAVTGLDIEPYSERQNTQQVVRADGAPTYGHRIGSMAVGRRPRSPHLQLSIPTSSVPGRRRSQQAKFSTRGDVSPPTELWIPADGQRYRQSAVSPISPEYESFAEYPFPTEQYTYMSPEQDSAMASRTRHEYPIPEISVQQPSMASANTTFAHHSGAGIPRTLPLQSQSPRGIYQQQVQTEPPLRHQISMFSTTTTATSPSNAPVNRGPSYPNRTSVTRKPVPVSVPTSKYIVPVSSISDTQQTNMPPPRFTSYRGQQQSSKRTPTYRYDSPEEMSAKFLKQYPSRSGKGRAENTVTHADEEKENIQPLSPSPHHPSGPARYADEAEERSRAIERWGEAKDRERIRLAKQATMPPPVAYPPTAVSKPLQQTQTSPPHHHHIRPQQSRPHQYTHSPPVPAKLQQQPQPPYPHQPLTTPQPPAAQPHHPTSTPLYRPWRDSQQDAWHSASTGTGTGNSASSSLKSESYRHAH